MLFRRIVLGTVCEDGPLQMRNPGKDTSMICPESRPQVGTWLSEAQLLHLLEAHQPVPVARPGRQAANIRVGCGPPSILNDLTLWVPQ